MEFNLDGTTMNLKSVQVGTSMVAIIISLTIWISLLFPLGTVLAQGNQQYSFVTKGGSEGIGNGELTQSIQIFDPMAYRSLVT